MESEEPTAVPVRVATGRGGKAATPEAVPMELAVPVVPGDQVAMASSPVGSLSAEEVKAAMVGRAAMEAAVGLDLRGMAEMDGPPEVRADGRRTSVLVVRERLGYRELVEWASVGKLGMAIQETKETLRTA